MRRFVMPIVIVLFAFWAARLTKWWMADFLAENGTTRINDFLTLTEVYNRGIAFGMMQGIGPLIGWLTIAVVLGLGVYLFTLPREQWLLGWGLAFLIGGALGNMIDRILFGEVLDFFLTPFSQGVFNVADVMVHVGVILALLATFLMQPRDPSPALETDPSL